MLPLAGNKLPSSADELQESLDESLTQVFSLPSDDAGVSIDGGKFPSIKTVKIDLDGATVVANKPPAKAIGVGKREPGVRADKVGLGGPPSRDERAKVNLKL